MMADVYAEVATVLFPGSQATHVVPLTGGVSADVYRLDLKLIDGGTTSLVLRAHGESHNGHAADIEYQLLQALHKHGLSVPEPLLVDVSGRLLASPFLVIEFIEGTSKIPASQQDQYITLMADTLAAIHALPVLEDLPPLPMRCDPLPEVFDYLPTGDEWQPLLVHLHSLSNTNYLAQPKLLHGDFWPENLLWRDGSLAAILDWEDAALGDPLSDVACCRLELRYKFGEAGMHCFTQAYAEHHVVDLDRLALWQIYVAAAAQRFMAEWGLDPMLEEHMRTQALSSIRQAGETLMRHQIKS